MNDTTIPDKKFDDLMRVYELYTDLQLRAETIYFNRSNLLLVAEGLLMVALSNMYDRHVALFSRLLAGLGTSLSLIWWVLEQRHLVHHESREQNILRPLESRLVEIAERTDRGFQPFWASTSAWVDAHAKWYQKHSVRRVIRNYMPLLFVVFWAVALGYLIYRDTP